MGCLCQIPALSAQGSRQKRKQKYFNKQRWYTTLRKQCLPNITGQRHYMWVYITHINCKSIHKTCVGLRDGGLPLRGGSDTMPIPNQEIIFNWCQLIKGKKSFLRWILPGCIKMFRSSQPIQNKLHDFLCS